MNTKRLASITLASVWPLASYAGAVDIPELGVHIPQVQDPTGTPRVIRRLDGYEATLLIGKATLIIARLDEPVPSGSDIRDVTFRSAQLAEFYEPTQPKAREQATEVSGQGAWTIVSTTGGSGTVNYRCVTYTVVDQHLYRLVAAASTGHGATPADFEAAVRVMSELTLGPVNPSSGGDPRLGTGLLKMPHRGHFNSRVDFYPPPQKLRGEEGVVDLEYSIDGRGRVRDIREIYADSRPFSTGAQNLLQAATFQVKPSWEAEGRHTLRFTTEVQFWLDKPGRGCPQDVLPRTAAAEVITVCGSPIPRR